MASRGVKRRGLQVCAPGQLADGDKTRPPYRLLHLYGFHFRPQRHERPVPHGGCSGQRQYLRSVDASSVEGSVPAAAARNPFSKSSPRCSGSPRVICAATTGRSTATVGTRKRRGSTEYRAAVKYRKAAFERLPLFPWLGPGTIGLQAVNRAIFFADKKSCISFKQRWTRRRQLSCN